MDRTLSGGAPPVAGSDTWYGDVDSGEERVGPVAACWFNNADVVSLTVVVFEHDEGDPDAYKDEVDAFVKAAIAVLSYFYPALAWLELLSGQIAGTINWVLGTGDDPVETQTVVLPRALLELYASQMASPTLRNADRLGWDLRVLYNGSVHHEFHEALHHNPQRRGCNLRRWLRDSPRTAGRSTNHLALTWIRTRTGPRDSPHITSRDRRRGPSHPAQDLICQALDSTPRFLLQAAGWVRGRAVVTDAPDVHRRLGDGRSAQSGWPGHVRPGHPTPCAQSTRRHERRRGGRGAAGSRRSWSSSVHEGEFRLEDQRASSIAFATTGRTGSSLPCETSAAADVREPRGNRCDSLDAWPPGAGGRVGEFDAVGRDSWVGGRANPVPHMAVRQDSGGLLGPAFRTYEVVLIGSYSCRTARHRPLTSVKWCCRRCRALKQIWWRLPDTWPCSAGPYTGSFRT